MNKIKEIIYKAVERAGFDKGNIFPFIFAISIALFFVFDTTYFHNRLVTTLWIFLAFVASILVAWLFLKAGFTVLRALFLLSAEISLLIFLAQSYCDVRLVTSPGDDALRGLLTLGIIYVSYEFFKHLKKALVDRLHSFPEKRWSWEKMLAVSLFLLFTVSFVWAVVQVVDPIVSNLCIYRR